MTDEKKKYVRGVIIAAAIIAFILIFDLVTKAVTDGISDITVISKFLIFTSIHNYNAAFGSSFGLDSGVFRAIVIVFTFIALAVIAFLLVWVKKKHMLFTVSLALIFSGALGNLIDRLALGYVRDFIRIEYFGLELFGSTSFAVFNIADAALVCGVIVLLVWMIIFLITGNKEKPLDPALVTVVPVPPKKEWEPVMPEPENKHKGKDKPDDGDSPDDKPEDGDKPDDESKSGAEGS